LLRRAKGERTGKIIQEGVINNIKGYRKMFKKKSFTVAIRELLMIYA
jgi:hypothetical protein